MSFIALAPVAASPGYTLYMPCVGQGSDTIQWVHPGSVNDAIPPGLSLNLPSNSDADMLTIIFMYHCAVKKWSN
jgi:hypothetical protein